MKKFMKKMFSMTFMFMFLLVSVFCSDKASALTNASTIASYSFSGSIASWNHEKQWTNYTHIGSANYLKVDIRTSGGDTFDLRFVAIDTYPTEYKILAQKKSISAKGNSYTFYFIPPNGSCPGSSSQCITVPAYYSNASGIYLSTNNNIADDFYVQYGIEVHNGSLLGGDVTVNGTYTFMNY